MNFIMIFNNLHLELNKRLVKPNDLDALMSLNYS
jgi:hypothetical protein